MEKCRKVLQSRGARGIIGLGRMFRIMDDNNSRTLDYYEFRKAMVDYQMGLEEQEMQALFNLADRDRSGEIDYDEFLRVVRGGMNDFRKALARQAFNKLDLDGSGVVDIEEIRQLYNARQHPDVRSGKKTEDEVLGEFLETFETHHNIGVQGGRDRRVTYEEFEEYYNNVSISIDDDRYFELMMNNAWKLHEPPAYT